MSRGLSLLPTPPVRANCRPDLHLGRLPVLPACVLHALSGIVIPVGVRSPASWRTTASRCHATNTLAARPLTERDKDKIFLLGIKSKIKFAAVKQCEDSPENACDFNELVAHTEKIPHPEEREARLEGRGRGISEWKLTGLHPSRRIASP